MDLAAIASALGTTDLEGSEGALSPQAALQLARMAELGTVSASLVHELRQPLMAAKALAQLVDGGIGGDAEGDAVLHQRLRSLVGQLEYAERLLAHYGAYGAPVGGPVLMDLNDVLQEVVEMLAHRLRPGAVRLVVDLSSDAVIVRARPVAVRQVVTNLLANALDAVVGLDQPRVRLVSGTEDGNAVIVVEDNGPGVDPAVANRAFDAFVTTKPAGRGTGLGLAISRQLVEQAGGTVELTRDGDITRATVRIPR